MISHNFKTKDYKRLPNCVTVDKTIDRAPKIRFISSNNHGLFIFDLKRNNNAKRMPKKFRSLKTFHPES